MDRYCIDHKVHDERRPSFFFFLLDNKKTKKPQIPSEMQKNCDYFLKKQNRKCKNRATPGSLYCHIASHKAAERIRFTLPRSVHYIEDGKLVERDLCPKSWLVTKQCYGGKLGIHLQEGAISQTKKGGWIYIFSCPTIEGHWKIGYTTQPLQTRMDQWRAKGHKELKVEACWYVPYHAEWYERIVHLILHRVRRFRVIETGAFEKFDARRISDTVPREIEWFSYERVGKAFLRAVCRLVIEEILLQENKKCVLLI